MPLAPFREGCRCGGPEQISWLSNTPPTPSRLCASGRAGRVWLDHSGGPASVLHRASLPPIRWTYGPPLYRWRGSRGGAWAPAGVGCPDSRRGEPGVTPGLTRSGVGDDRIAVPLGPEAWEGDPGGRPRARTSGREHQPVSRLGGRLRALRFVAALPRRSTTMSRTARLATAVVTHAARPRRRPAVARPPPTRRSTTAVSDGADWIESQQAADGTFNPGFSSFDPTATALAPAGRDAADVANGGPSLQDALFTALSDPGNGAHPTNAGGVRERDPQRLRGRARPVPHLRRREPGGRPGLDLSERVLRRHTSFSNVAFGALALSRVKAPRFLLDRTVAVIRANQHDDGGWNYGRSVTPDTRDDPSDVDLTGRDHGRPLRLGGRRVGHRRAGCARVPAVDASTRPPAASCRSDRPTPARTAGRCPG